LNSLSTELQKVGFVDVKRVQPGQSEDPLLKNLEARMEPSEAATSLVVEARRPRSR
jgi:hypothetical protein